jgi:hypothetical protein
MLSKFPHRLFFTSLAVAGCVSSTALAAGGQPPAQSSMAKPAKIVVTAVDANGKRTTADDSVILCPQASKRENEAIARTGVCGTVKRGVATLHPKKAGAWYVRAYGGLGGGPCYQATHAHACSRVTVSAGKTTKIKWAIPSFG